MISNAVIGRLRTVLEEPDFGGTKYACRGEIGRGGMGVVYLAHDAELGRDVAVKVLDWTATSADATAQLLHEARILARLEHPGIVPVHDVGRLADGRIFYAMKLVQGQRLDAWLLSERDLHARLRVFAKICETVSFAHAQGVVHCDLKPENVMIGPFGEVLVLDWGIARVTRRPSDEVAEPAGSRAAAGDWSIGPGVVAGTPAYMPPEQAEAAMSVDARADVHALGVILAELGAPSRALRAIAAKARAHAPEDRYQSVGELSSDIGRFLADLAVSAEREQPWDAVARFVRRHRLPLALVAAYLVMRALMLWWLRL